MSYDCLKSAKARGISLNAILSVSNLAKGPWKFYFVYLNETMFLSMEFRYILCSMNEAADVLDKRGASQYLKSTLIQLIFCN